MYGTVTVSNNLQQSDDSLRIRLYYPVRALAGPEWMITRSYEQFILLYGEDETVKFLFDRDYELLCNRVSYVSNPANCTKYSDGTFGADIGDYTNTKLIYTSKDSVADSTYTYHIRFSSDSSIDFNNFYLLVQRYVKDLSALITNNTSMYSQGIFGKDYIASEGSGDWNLGKSEIQNEFNLTPTYSSVFMPNFEMSGSIAKPITYTLEDLENAILEFLSTDCALDIQVLGEHHYLISTNTPDLQINCSNSDLCQVVASSREYYDRIQASQKWSNRVLSISSLYNSAVSDIKVTISAGNYNMYKVQVYKTDGNTVNEEYFEVAKEDISTIGSSIVSIKLIDKDGDITGTYELTGATGYYEESYELGYLELLDVDEVDIPQVDIVLDTTENGEIYKQYRRCFPNALILSNNVETSSNLISISPQYVKWSTLGLKLPSYFVLLDLLPEYVSMFSKRTIELIEDDSELGFQLKEADYEYVITDLYIHLNKSPDLLRYSLRSAVARAMICRCFSELHAVTADGIREEIASLLNQINSYLSAELNYEILSERIVGAKYTAAVKISLENRIFENFTLQIEVNYDE